MGSGIDLGKLIPSVLFGFFIFAAFTLTYTEMGNDFGVKTLSNSTFDFNHSITAAKQIEKIVDQNTTNPGLISSFFPGIPLMMNLVTIIKSTTVGVLKDITNIFDTFFVRLSEHGITGPGANLLLTLKTIFITVIVLSIAFIILAALFRQQTFKER